MQRAEERVDEALGLYTYVECIQKMRKVAQGLQFGNNVESLIQNLELSIGAPLDDHAFVRLIPCHIGN